MGLLSKTTGAPFVSALSTMTLIVNRAKETSCFGILRNGRGEDCCSSCALNSSMWVGYVLPHVVEVGDYPLVPLVPVLQVLDRRVQGVEGDCPLQFVQHLLDEFFRIAHRPEDLVEPFLEPPARLLHLFLGLFVELGELLGASSARLRPSEAVS